MSKQHLNPLTKMTSPNNAEDIHSLMAQCSSRIGQALNHWLPQTQSATARLHEAMRYSVLGGGKHIRPLLVYATGKVVGASPKNLDAAACAVELIHAYSLIHDDLPAMDDDDLRRGRATCHIAFDEATAILAGDALQSLAFKILVTDPNMNVSDERRIQMVTTLADASGGDGMAGGQAIDLQMVGKKTDLATLEHMHSLKTGALIQASVALGALNSSTISDNVLECLDNYARCIGLAFQIRDDILDVESDTETLGKQQGADIALNKPTYPALLGMEEAKLKAQDLHEEALTYLEKLDLTTDPLRWISEYIVRRNK